MIALWLLACTGAVHDSADSGSSTETGDCGCWTGVRGVLFGSSRTNPAPESGGHVSALSADSERIETVSGDDGSWTLPLWPASWTLSADNAGGDCVTEHNPVIDLVACEPQSADLFTDACIG